MPSEPPTRANIAGGRTVASATSALPRIPLTSADIRAVHRLRAAVEPDLAARSAPRMPAADLERQEALVRRLEDTGLGLGEKLAIHESFYLGLFRPAATNSELHVVRTLVHIMAEHVRAELRRTGFIDVEPGEVAAIPRALLDGYRSGSPASAKAAVRAHLDVARSVALHLSALPDSRAGLAARPRLG
jgi:DNA-binding GntR family transcriptional regulator